MGHGEIQAPLLAHVRRLALLERPLSHGQRTRVLVILHRALHNAQACTHVLEIQLADVTHTVNRLLPLMTPDGAFSSAGKGDALVSPPHSLAFAVLRRRRVGVTGGTHWAQAPGPKRSGEALDQSLCLKGLLTFLVGNSIKRLRRDKQEHKETQNDHTWRKMF